MRKKFSYSTRQQIEMNKFFKICLRKDIDFNNYSDLCKLAKKFIRYSNKKKIKIHCLVPLLSFSAIALSRGDNLNDVVKRDFEESGSVRLPLFDEIKKLYNFA